MQRTHNITNDYDFDAEGNKVINPRRLFVEIVESWQTPTGLESKILMTGTFDTKAAAYDFIDRWGARRARITLDPTTGGKLQLRLAGSRR